MNTSEPIRISTTPAFGAYIGFLMWAVYRQFRFLVPFAVLAVLCFLFAPFFPLEQQGSIARYRALLPILILPGIIFVLLPVSTYLAARKRWAIAEELRAPRTYLFSDSGIELIGETFRSQVSWQHVRAVVERKKSIMLGTAQKQFYLVPLKDFNPPEQLPEFRELLRKNVAGCKL